MIARRLRCVKAHATLTSRSKAEWLLPYYAGVGPVASAALHKEVAVVFEIASIREWRGHDVVDAGVTKSGNLRLYTSIPVPTCRRSARSRSGYRPGVGSYSCP
jgi:hypothetical protein